MVVIIYEDGKEAKQTQKHRVPQSQHVGSGHGKEQGRYPEIR